MQSPILVLGLGNLLLGDEGLGIRALERLQAEYELPAEVSCIDGGVLGLELLAYVDGVTRLLVIDAVQTRQPPGTLVRLEGEQIPQALALKLSMHQVTFQEVLAMCQLRGTTPPQLVIWGMEPAVLETGVELSEIVENQLNHLVQKVLEELQCWGIRANPIVQH
jgi:hydrogenase maturation protease